MTLREFVIQWVREAFPQLFYGSLYEFRVVAVSAGRLDLRPVDTKVVGPQPRVYQWTLSGSEPTPVVGTSVVLAFLDADPGKPVVVGYGPQRTAPGGSPSAMKIDTTGALTLGPSASSVVVGSTFTPGAAPAAVGHFVRYGDTVSVGSSAGPMTWVSGAISKGES